MMIKSILLQLSKLRQSDRAFGLRDGTSQHNDTRVRSDSMDDLNVNRRFACPSSHIFVGRVKWIHILLERGTAKGHNIDDRLPFAREPLLHKRFYTIGNTELVGCVAVDAGSRIAAKVRTGIIFCRMWLCR